jgi:DNA-binding NarL/FixJ family response regulator
MNSSQPPLAGEIPRGRLPALVRQLAAGQPLPRGSLHTRSTLGVADGDQPFVRALRQLRGSRALRCYDSAAAVLAAGEQARAAGGAPPWDGVIVSLGLSDLHGNAVIARLREGFPQLTLWAAIGLEESHSLLGAICAGADGYLVKSGAAASDRANLAALDPERPPFGRAMAVSLLQLAGDPAWNRRGHTPASLPPGLGLSRQQLQLLRLIARGDAVPAVAERMAVRADEAWLILRGIYHQLRRTPLRAAVPQALRLQLQAQLGGR